MVFIIFKDIFIVINATIAPSIITFTNVFEYILNLVMYSVIAYIAPIALANKILKYDILLFEIYPVAYKII